MSAVLLQVPQLHLHEYCLGQGRRRGAGEKVEKNLDSVVAEENSEVGSSGSPRVEHRKIMEMIQSCSSERECLCEIFKILDFRLEKQIHASVTKGNWNNLIVDSALLYLYAQCGDLPAAFRMFNGIPVWDVKDLKLGKQLHAAEIVERVFKEDVFVGSSLVAMYAKCGEVLDARPVFDLMPRRNTVTRTSMIAGYAQNDLGAEAVELFRKMKSRHIFANKLTVVSVLSACGLIRSLLLGNPGISGGGDCVKNFEGDILLAFAFHYGFGNSLQAEVRALHDGLKLAEENGIQIFMIYSDSAILVEVLREKDGTSLINAAKGAPVSAIGGEAPAMRQVSCSPEAHAGVTCGIEVVCLSEDLSELLRRQQDACHVLDGPHPGFRLLSDVATSWLSRYQKKATPNLSRSGSYRLAITFPFALMFPCVQVDTPRLASEGDTLFVTFLVATGAVWRSVLGCDIVVITFSFPSSFLIFGLCEGGLCLSWTPRPRAPVERVLQAAGVLEFQILVVEGKTVVEGDIESFAELSWLGCHVAVPGMGSQLGQAAVIVVSGVICGGSLASLFWGGWRYVGADCLLPWKDTTVVAESCLVPLALYGLALGCGALCYRSDALSGPLA
ncbi:hypothetical protein Taro_005658 [Colocasia esculenta]|uniref:RNase H type-1 domain-containing protein n=1 Tax=Colocasia esculenta TaxID=4460 RepID=A0A843TUY1_COLES|nr:hypothetical protein [Colocasia esculenta]